MEPQKSATFGVSGGKYSFAMKDSKRITKIKLCLQNGIRSMTVQYEATDGTTKWTNRFGGAGGTPVEISFEADEYIKEMPVKKDNVGITFLCFTLNTDHDVKCGEDEGKDRTFSSNGGKIIGFHGSYSDQLTEIGVYTRAE